MAAQKEKEQRFDQVKLQGMHEPLTVRVEKIRGNVRQPIELPPKGNEQTGFSPPGTGWTRDEVLQLENFVLTKWAGGGYYEFTVTDAKNDRMTWQGVWDPRLYPEKVPPNTAEAAMIGAATNPMPVAGPQVVPGSVQPLGLQQQTGWPPSGTALGYNNPPFSGPVMPPVQPTPAPVAAPVAAPAPSQAPPMWNPMMPQPYTGGFPGYGMPFGPQSGMPGFGMPGYGMPGYGMPNPFGYPPPPRPRAYEDEDTRARRARFFERDEEEKREAERREAEKRELENKLRQAELNQKELEYKSTLERIQQQQAQALQQQQQAHAQQMQALQEEIRRMADGRGKGEDDEVRRMREEQQRQREAAQAEQQRLREQAATERATLERQIAEQQLLQMRAQSEAQVQALREQIARMNEQPRGESEEFRRLQAEQERQAREFERQRQEDQRRLEAERAERERERERHERERREEALQREMREQAAATERRFEQMMTARNASDPVIDMMKETARASAENMREIARMQAESTNRMSQFMVSPVQVAQLMKENNSGADGMLRSIVGTVGEIGNLYKNAAETIMQMSGGGGEPPAVRLIQEGMARAGEVAERFLAVKRDSVISEAKVKQAEAQRDATKIQAEAALRSQAMHAQTQAQQQQRWSTPPPVANANGGGLGGVNAKPQQPQQQQPQRPHVQPTSNGHTAKAGPIEYVEPATQPKQTGPIDLPPEPPAPPNNTGPTEEEMFGLALESVHRLRRGVAEGKLNPSETIDAILKGVEHVVTNQLVIPAFVLFQQERWADFVDVMLPAAPSDFKHECVRILIEEVEPSDPAEPADPGGALVPSSVS